jgi:membrane protease YdiL (CAAX protease family)
MNQYQSQYQQPYGQPSLQKHHDQLHHKKPIKRWAMIIGLGLLLNITIQLVLGRVWFQVSGGLYSYGLSDGLISLLDESALLFIYVASLWPVTLLVLSWIKIPPELAFPLKRPRLAITLPGLFVCLGASMVGFLVTSGISWFLEFMFGVYPYMPEQPLPVGIAANVVSIISMTLVPAVFEELLFRGVILQSLRRFGDGFAIIVSSVLFGLLHGNLIQGVTTTIIGLLMGYFTLRTGSLLPAMLFHFVNNAMATAFTYASEYLPFEQVQILDMAMFASYVLLGIVGLAFLVFKIGGLFRVAPSSYPLPISKKIAAFFLNPAQIIFLVIIFIFTVSYLQPV